MNREEHYQKGFMARIDAFHAKCAKKGWPLKVYQEETRKFLAVEKEKEKKFKAWLEGSIGKHFRTHFFMDRGEFLDLVWLAKCMSSE